MDSLDLKKLPLILEPHECSNNEYHNGFLKDFYGSSTISSFAYLTPIEAKLKNEEDFADTLATRLGSAFHFIMESEKVYKENVIYTKLDNRYKEYKELAKSLDDGQILVPEKYAGDIRGMKVSMYNHSLSHYVNSMEAKKEWSYAYQDEYGLKVKIRPDLIRKGIKDKNKDIIVDFKSTKSVNPKSFSKSVKDYNYHIQAAHYIETYQNITGKEVEEFVFACVEKTFPYLCNFFTLGYKTLKEGNIALHHAKKKLRYCLDTDDYGGYEETYNEDKEPIPTTIDIGNYNFEYINPYEEDMI